MSTTSPIRRVHQFPHHLFFTRHLFLILRSLNPPNYLFIYPCSQALKLILSFFISHLIMVSTRTKNKSAHPAAPVMTEAAKKKAGIPTKRRSKKATKDDTIRELEARIAALESPGGDPFSKEPLVRIFHSSCLVWGA
jgi:hypothetical protein